MEYKELSKIYHMDTSSSRERNLELAAEERRNAPSTFRLGYQTKAGELFIATPTELSVLNERILRRERRISKLMRQLPPIGSDEVLRSLVFDEVVSSNVIENIHSTREQIEEALSEAAEDLGKKRFREFARIYLDFIADTSKTPETLEDIRGTYDRIMEGEPLSEEHHGKLFRADTVSVTNGLKIVHQGLHPEESIAEALETMLEIVSSDEIPALYAALASHYIFEYAHPFYDGNGRTGRYLLSVFLDQSLSRPTALSLSRAIAENKDEYYRAFQITDDPLNKGELTFFVMTLMEFIFKSQEELMARLESNIEKIHALSEAMEQKGIAHEYREREVDIIFILAQFSLFGMRLQVPLKDLARNMFLSTQQTRAILSQLEKLGVVERVRKRNPITFRLTKDFVKDRLSEVFE